MDEVKTLDQVTNGIMEMNTDTVKITSVSSAPEQFTQALIKQEASNDNKTLDSSIDEEKSCSDVIKKLETVTSEDVNAQLDKVDTDKQVVKSIYGRAYIDTTAPFESVKAAVSMFGGIVDWKAHKIKVAERRIHIQQELKKANEEVPILKKKSEEAEKSKDEVLKELSNRKRLIEELKLNLERSQTEERQAKQDAELATLRVEELEQGIGDDTSVSTKVQLEVAQARHQAAVAELESVKIEHENLKKDYVLLIKERDLAVKNAKKAVTNSKEIEKTVETLTIKLITTKEDLESAHAAHLEAEEHRLGVNMAYEQDIFDWENELKESKEELENINQQIGETDELKKKLDTASVLLRDLKCELAKYMEEDHKDIQASVLAAKTNLEEVKKNIETATKEINNLKKTANSLNLELEKEEERLVSYKKKEETAAVAAESVEAELKKTISEVSHIQTKEKEAREKISELPKQLQTATQEASNAKSRARKAREELRKAKKTARKAKTEERKMLAKLQATLKDIESTRASERLALGAISALHESASSARSEKSETKESGVTLSLEEYYDLSRQAKEADDQANSRVSEAISQIDRAKESEVKAISMLEQVNSDLASKKEKLVLAMQKAEKANEGKLAVEQELRTWRSENEQKRKAGGGKKEGKISDNYKPEMKTENNDNEIGPSNEVKPRRRKKRSIFPRFFMFFRKKPSSKNSSSSHNNNTSSS